MNKTPWIALALLLVVSLPGLPAGAQGGCGGLVADKAVDAINQARAQGATCGGRGVFAAAAPLRWNPTLERVARQQAAWVAERGHLTHGGRDGQTLAQRAAAGGYRYTRVAENLAQGPGGVREAIAIWTASDGHCANLFDPGVSEMALACAVPRDDLPIWVLVLGMPTSPAAPAPAR